MGEGIGVVELRGDKGVGFSFCAVVASSTLPATATCKAGYLEFVMVPPHVLARPKGRNISDSAPGLNRMSAFPQSDHSFPANPTSASRDKQTFPGMGRIFKSLSRASVSVRGANETHHRADK